MATNFYFKSLDVKNYRGLTALSIEKFKRINIIGGYNGSGKTTLLEVLFFLLDRGNPLALIRPYIWRKLEASMPFDFSQMFSKQITDQPISIKAKCRQENSFNEHELTLTYSYPPQNFSATIGTKDASQHAAGTLFQQDTSQSLMGITMETNLDGVSNGSLFWAPMPDGIAMNLISASAKQVKIAPGIILNTVSRYAPAEDAQRFSNIFIKKKVPELLEALNIITPNIKNLQILQPNNLSLIYAELEDETILPVSMLGDGIQTLLSIALGIMSAENGVIFLDEFDTAIHYSKLKLVWKKIAELSNQYNCQVFAATHSRECIQAASDGIAEGGYQQDLQYIRLQRIPDEKFIKPVIYSGQELADALEGEWEIR